MLVPDADGTIISDAKYFTSKNLTEIGFMALEKKSTSNKEKLPCQTLRPAL
ncbi:MAG: hypothetical protein HUJ51_01040 [Eggerthellaceae bacterium]|nr:hypothetical protein [Eggerthellaceae bacterium]